MKWMFSIVLLGLCLNARCAPITIDDPNDYRVLDRFFRMMCTHAEYGYVLEGSKPVSQMNILPLDDLIAPQSINFQISTCAREAIRIWKKMCPEHDSFALKATEIHGHFSNPVYELIFVNVPKLQSEIEANINLFRYVLGPTIAPEQLVQDIVQSKRSLHEILQGDKVLTGIVLGFGPYNSLMHSRAEELQNALMAKDEPPFKSNTDLMNHQGGIAQWDEIQLKVAFLSQGNEGLSSAEHDNTLKPGLKFSNLQDELNAILSQRDSVPVPLSKDKPRFVFGAYKHVDNQRMIRALEDSQRKTKALLTRPDFLAYVLEKVTGEKPLLTSVFSEASSNKLALQEKAESLVAETIWMIGNQLDIETRPEFVDAFCRSDPSEITRGMTHALPGALEGLKQAKLNLQFADAWFAIMPKAAHLKEIIPDSLYFEPVTVGAGKKVDSFDRLLVSYIVEDQYNNILTVGHHKWIKLSTTIPGFAYGVQGMQEGETRTIYIHPSLAYGALTTLPACSSLIVKITLHQIDENSPANLPLLKTIDLAWVKDPHFYRELEEANHQMARSFGSRWGTWIKQSSDLDFAKICDQLKQLSNLARYSEQIAPHNSEDRETREHICNRIFWDLLSRLSNPVSKSHLAL